MQTGFRLTLGALIFAGGAAAVLAQSAAEDYANFPWLRFDLPSIQYIQQPPQDAFTKLQKKLDAGETKLAYDPKWGYLPDLLKHLDINPDTQMLVFSKTSFQLTHISPQAPRALYFKDDVYVGTVQDGDVLELAALDPKQGTQFYTMDIHQTTQPRFERRDMVCIQCHMSAGTLNVPGVIITSATTSADGTPFIGTQSATDHRTPLADRWGGWYVTGTAGRLRHHGNAVIRDSENTQNLLSLSKKFDTSRYLEPTSDIVALMTIEHQTRMTDLMTRIDWEERIARGEGKLDEFQGRLNALVDDMVRYMLFADEAKMSDPIVGSSTFMKSFPTRGPRDHQGRSLRDFDLQKRLFRYPLSYMIYSEAFDAMPAIARDRVYHKLYDVLSGKDVEAFPRLSAEDRKNVLEIVRETKPNLPDYWKASAN
jgi:hypothetical protein